MIPLIISAIEGPDDREFMEGIYNTYHRLMYAEIHKILQDPWDIEDVMQTVLSNLIRKVSTLRGFDRSQRINYIIVASRNTALNFIRDSKRSTLVPYDEELVWAEDRNRTSEDYLEMVELWEDAGRAWRSLSERDRRILEMKYTLERSDAEIAKELGVKPNSVRMLLTRARNNMRDKLKGEATEEQKR